MPQDFLNVDVAKHKRATNDICLTTMQHRKILAAFSFCAHIKWHKTFSSCCILGFNPKGYLLLSLCTPRQHRILETGSRQFILTFNDPSNFSAHSLFFMMLVISVIFSASSSFTLLFSCKFIPPSVFFTRRAVSLAPGF